METNYWKSSPFGVESIFHPSWEEKERNDRNHLLSNVRILDVYISQAKPNYKEQYIPQDNLSPERYTPASIRLDFQTVYISVFVIVSGRAEAIYITVNNQCKRAIDHERTFEVKISKSSAKETIKVKVALTDFIGKEVFDEKEYLVTIDSGGNVLMTKEVEIRKSVKKLQPSQEFYLLLKKMEGLGYNVRYNKDGIEERVFPYDDGGKMGEGNATIGYGHLIDTKPFDPSDPKHKKWIGGITLDEAEDLLVQDVKNKISTLERVINVNLLQHEYDALLLCLFNGGMGDTLIMTINKGVENLTPEEIFRAFLTRRYIKKTESDGLIYRRACEAEIFVYKNYMPYPSEKFENRSAFIAAFKKFLTTGILPLLFVLAAIIFSACKYNQEKTVPSDEQKTEERISDSINEELHIATNPDTYRLKYPYDKQYAHRYRHYGFSSEYQYNEMLFDSNDSLLMQMDTVLEYSTPSHYYNVSLKKENVTVSVWKWKDMPDDTKPPIVMHGYQKNGFIYIEDEQGEYEMCYKIVLGKCLFVWMPHTGWASIPCGRKGRR